MSAGITVPMPDYARQGGEQASPGPKPASTSPLRLVLTLLLFGTLWVFWVIILAGTAAGQKTCVDSYGGGSGGGGKPNNNQLDFSTIDPKDQQDIIKAITGRRMLSHGRVLLASASTTCITLFSLPWWIVWFQFICIVSAMALAASPSLHSNFSMSVVVIFAIQTTLLMQESGNLNTTILNTEGGGDIANKARSAAMCTMAGSVVLSILNLIYMACTASKVESLAPSLGLQCCPAQQPTANASTASTVTTAAGKPVEMASTTASYPPSYTVSGASEAIPVQHVAASPEHVAASPEHVEAVITIPPQEVKQ